MARGGLMAPSLVALGLAGFSLYPIAMAWGCEEASRDELVTMNQLLLLSYSVGTLAGPSLTSFDAALFGQLDAAGHCPGGPAVHARADRRGTPGGQGVPVGVVSRRSRAETCFPAGG